VEAGGEQARYGREIVAETTEREEEIVVTAVVAEKMRERAEEADAATDEIAGMIEQVQLEAGEAIERVRKGTRRMVDWG